jgi:hypothetical protein
VLDTKQCKISMDAPGFGDKNVMIEDDETSVEFLEKIYSSFPKH